MPIEPISALPRGVPLAAGDYFMHGQDRRMRRLGMPGNVCHAVLRLDPGFDIELLRQRLAASPIINWLGRMRITRPLLVLSPRWRAASQPRKVLHEHDIAEWQENRATPFPFEVLAGHDMHACRGPSLAFHVLRHPDGSSHLVLSWNHTLMDARGVDLILKHLSTSPNTNGGPTLENVIDPKQKPRSLASWWENMKTAHGSVKWLQESGREPLFSLLPPGKARPAGPCRNLYRSVPFTLEETARIDARAQRLNATFRRSHFYLAATIRGIHAVALGRGNREGAYLIPVPHDTRRRGSNGPIFSNHLSILFYRIEPQQVANLSQLMAELMRQMMDQIRTRFPECCMAALNMFMPLPLDYYVHHLGEPTRGKIASFCFSDSGESCPGMTDFLGGRIRDVTHLVPAWRPPGFTALFLTFGGRLRGLLSWVEDCLTTAEVDLLEARMRTTLLEEEVP